MKECRCKICSGKSTPLFNKSVLRKFEVSYHECTECGFIQTDEPVWLQEAYSNAITSLDIGLINRNLVLKEETAELIDALFPEAVKFLDYAGGYGMFVRLMRDAGFEFYRQDIYCENLFAKHFDVTDLPDSTRFDVLTAFEVAEHLVEPIEEFRKMFLFSDNVVFSTQLLPQNRQEIPAWWYIAEETGQHIAFYTRRSLEHIAKIFGKRYYNNGQNLHMFSSLSFPQDRADYVFNGIRSSRGFFRSRDLSFSIQRQSLLEKDFNYIRELIRKGLVS